MLSNLNKALRDYSLPWIRHNPGLLERFGFSQEVPNPLGHVPSISPDFGPPVESQGKRDGSPGHTDGLAKGTLAKGTRARAHTRKHTHTRARALNRETKFHLLKPWGEEKAFQGIRASTIRGRAEIPGSSPQPFQDRSRRGPRRPQAVHPLLPP